MTMTRPTTEQITHNGILLSDRLDQVFNVMDYGAAGDGIVDDTNAIQAAVNAGVGTVVIPAGTYKVTSTITVPGNVRVVGDGIGATVIDGSSIAAGFVLAFVGASLVSVGTVSSATVNTNTVTMSAPPSPAISPNDVIIVWNPTLNSWSSARSYYTQGEFCTVQSVSGSAVTVTGALYDTYGSGVNVYSLARQSAQLHDLSIKSPIAYGSGDTGAVSFTRIVNGRMSNVTVFGGTNTSVNVEQCYGFVVESCQVSDNLFNDTGDDYGIGVSNSQDVDITSCKVNIHGSHAITTGGSGATGSVITRAVRIDNCTLEASAGTAADTHGNSEFVSYTNCVLSRGALIAGDHMEIRNCIIRGQQPAFAFVRMYEMRGCSVSIVGNWIESDDSSQATLLVDTADSTVVGGVVNISDNTFLARNATIPATIAIVNNNATLAGHRVKLSGNMLISSGAAGIGSVQVTTGSNGTSAATPWEHVELSGNYANSKTYLFVGKAGANPLSDVAAIDVVATDNVLVGGSDRPILLNAMTRCVVSGNVIRGCLHTGIWVNAASSVASTKAELVDVSGNALVSCVTGAPALTNNLDADIYVAGAVTAVVKGNSHYSVNATKPRAFVMAVADNLYVGEYAATYSPRVLPVDATVTAFATGTVLSGSATYDPPNINDGAGTTTTVTVTGASLGDLVESVSFSLDLQGITVTGYVSAANTVSVRFQNESGGALDLGSGTLRVRVRKA